MEIFSREDQTGNIIFQHRKKLLPMSRKEPVYKIRKKADAYIDEIAAKYRKILRDANLFSL